MIVEERVYTLRPGAVPEYLAFYEAEGMAVQVGHLGRPIGYYSTEAGTLNQIVHLWAYQDANDRQRRRAALYADPAWQAIVAKLFTLIDKMENRLLNPAPFWRTAIR